MITKDTKVGELLKNPIAQDVLAQLRGRVGLVLDGGDARGGVPSTVVDCTRSPVAILRHGAIPDDEIFQALNQT